MARTKGSGNSTREGLLNAAADLMIERASTDVSLGDIAERSGSGSALVKYHFGSKAGLMVALINRSVGPTMSELQSLLQSDLSPEDKLRHHVRGMARTYSRYPYLNRLLHMLLGSDNEDVALPLAQTLVVPVAAAQKAILDEGIAAGVFKPIDPTCLFFQISGACDALFYSKVMLRHAFGITDDIGDIKQAYAEYVAESILAGILKDK